MRRRPVTPEPDMKSEAQRQAEAAAIMQGRTTLRRELADRDRSQGEGVGVGLACARDRLVLATTRATLVGALEAFDAVLLHTWHLADVDGELLPAYPKEATP